MELGNSCNVRKRPFQVTSTNYGWVLYNLFQPSSLQHQELELRGGKLDASAERLQRAGACGKWKQNVERDCMRAISGGILDMVLWPASNMLLFRMVFFLN